ncbi:hypothetical protein RBE51_21390 [Pseudomonas taiwanensis]|uniref:hypothetical protein n=1 Tax=Pseudomonas taiwanensis TaxID=470150 RepID=UPI0028E088D9|nr:hypothetical protein [Pseudomonas taiwanensis]MDT8925353.1 hypothetical protein [Pseudomonas taiwanensis]
MFIGQLAYLQRFIVEMDPLLIRLIPARTVEPANYLELAFRAVTANAQAITRLDPDFMLLHAAELVALHPAAVDFIPAHLETSLSQHLQGRFAPAVEASCPIEFRDFSLGEISTQVKAHGYGVLIKQIKEGWWPRSCNPMKPKDVADCFRHLKGTPGNFAFLLKAWLGAQPLKDVCQFIETDAHLRVAAEVFGSRELAEGIAAHGPLLAGLLECDLGL